MYLHCINLRKVKEKFVLFVFFYFSTKWAEKIEENLITEHLSLGGPFFWAHPVKVNKLLIPKINLATKTPGKTSFLIIQTLFKGLNNNQYPRQSFFEK